MTTLLLICGLYFSAPAPIPSLLPILYEAALNCPVEQPENIPRHFHQVIPIQHMNDYFSQPVRTWPLLDGQTPDLIEKVKSWRALDIYPGILLPDRHHWHQDKSMQRRLWEAVQAGGVPIATLPTPRPALLESERYFWCFHQLCPGAWRLTQPIESMTLALPPALYLVPPQIGNYPLPPTLMQIDTHRFMTLNKNYTQGVQAVINPANYIKVFTPPLTQHWRWLGITFQQDETGVTTSLSGYLFLQWGSLSMTLWEMFENLQIQFWHFITQNFSWLAMLFAISNLLIFTFYTWLRKLFRGRP